MKKKILSILIILLFAVSCNSHNNVIFSNTYTKIYKNSEKLMPLIHLPVQSGSDKILQSMNRKHTIKDYLNLIYKLKKYWNNRFQ